jgi:hypothetical protein
MSGFENITVREARAQDATALDRLAALDGTRFEDGRALLAEVDGEVRAALLLGDGQTFADPFRRTAELVALLEVRARQVAAAQPERPRRRGVTIPLPRRPRPGAVRP